MLIYTNLDSFILILIKDSSNRMMLTANFIFVVNLVQASLPSLAEIISRARLCLGENAHCPVNVYKDLDLCCKPLVCTVIPKTCKPNFFNRYFEISDYKDYRCLVPTKSLTPSEPKSQNVTLESFDPTSAKNKLEITTSSSFLMYSNLSSVDLSLESNLTSNETFNSNKYYMMNRLSNCSDDIKENEEENDDKSISNESFHGSLLDSQSSLDISNEIRRLVKRYVSNNSSYVSKNNPRSDSSLSISSISLERENNNTFSQNSQFSISSVEGNSSISSVEQNSSSEEEYSGSASNSGEVYDETKTEESSLQTESNHRISSSVLLANQSVEDWHSSDMKPDSRPNVFKIVTVVNLPWLQTDAKVVRLNLSSEISE